MTAVGVEDRGDADPALVAALATRNVVTIREALLTARLLVPIVAMAAPGAAEPTSDGAEMAAPRLIGADGRHALPVFSCYDSLRAWRADARPVPMPGEQAVAAAFAEGYDAVVLDVAGPVAHVVELTRPPTS